ISFHALSGTATFPASGGRGYAIFASTARTGIPNQPNASCSTPTVVTTSGNVANIATNNLRSGSSPPSGFGINDTSAVWFSYMATSNVPIIASPWPATIDTTVAVYTSCGGAAIAGNNDYPGCGTGGSTVKFLATAGQTYLFRVAGNNGARGNFTFHLED